MLLLPSHIRRKMKKVFYYAIKDIFHYNFTNKLTSSVLDIGLKALGAIFYSKTRCPVVIIIASSLAFYASR